MHLSWMIRKCINWILWLKIFIVRCWISSRLSYLFISCVWFKNIRLINTVRTRSLVGGNSLMIWIIVFIII